MKSFTAAVVIIVLFGTPALAADMALKAPSPAAAPANPTWTGFYVGANAGYAWHDPAVTFIPNDPLSETQTCGGNGGGTCPSGSASFNLAGGLGGVQAGYNWQVGHAWVVGLEADLDTSNIRGTGTSPNFSLGGFSSNFQASQKVEWFGTIRGRVGFLPTNNLLLYGTGGLATGRVDQNVALNTATDGGNNQQGLGYAYWCASGPNYPTCFTGHEARTALGWTLGGGAEYDLGRGLSLKAEYLYVNLGSNPTVNVSAVSINAYFGFPPSSFTANYNSTLAFQVARAGVNWKF
jgi:outer membrane immunogenic protein